YSDALRGVVYTPETFAFGNLHSYSPARFYSRLVRGPGALMPAAPVLYFFVVATKSCKIKCPVQGIKMNESNVSVNTFSLQNQSVDIRARR
ncbi:MAG: hypothetical protein FWF54_00160, partial [Candidatus Azobacteroides sp.]|nr:hypothetical protein [Candidatus Azobacteroides sp.]